MRIYRVSCLKPLQYRERKPAIYLYRVAASSEENAIALVRAELAARGDGLWWRVVGCEDFTDPGTVVLDSIYTITPSQAAQLKDLP